MKTYCFDFDGVICNIDSDNYKDRTPIDSTISLMRDLRYRGDVVIIHTGRHIDNLAVTKSWLSKNKVSYDHIQFGKPVADIYIDDKALRFNGKWGGNLSWFNL